MGIFEQYGIKEVADVTIYSIHKKQDGSGAVYYVPALYLDTLKVSTIEKTAEKVDARGGYGNKKLITWNFGKDIVLNLEDAFFKEEDNASYSLSSFSVAVPFFFFFASCM